eukprot:Skav230210  [mRNA]  locus=scaffold1765:42517:47567:- [translate_table: standard]
MTEPSDEPTISIEVTSLSGETLLSLEHVKLSCTCDQVLEQAREAYASLPDLPRRGLLRALLLEGQGLEGSEPLTAVLGGSAGTVALTAVVGPLGSAATERRFPKR